MQKAFTMIELIFVIVIIGILAAVAIPKLAATRNDAEVAARANEVASAANEIAAYAIAHGAADSNMSKMSNVVKGMITQNKATLAGGVLSVKMNSVSDCLKLTMVNSATDMNLTLSYGNAGGDSVCMSFQGAINSEDYPIPLRGIRVKL